MTHQDAAAIDVADAFIGYRRACEDEVQQEPEIRGVNGHVPIDIAAHQHDQRQMILIRADGVRRISPWNVPPELQSENTSAVPRFMFSIANPAFQHPAHSFAGGN